MTSWKPYVWKEVHQSQRLALGALGVFLAISFIPSALASLRAPGHWYHGNPLAAMFLAGPILAVAAGVYAMGREQGAVEQFWRARPINLHLWLLSKYVIGLAIVGLACWTPLVITMLAGTSEPPDGPVYKSISMPLAYSFILLLIYSASFVLGQLVRGILHAAILAVAAMALIFVIPLVVAPLNWLSVGVLQKVDLGVSDLLSYLAFAVGMTALSIALLCLAGILLKRGIRIDADQRTLSWSLVAVLLVLAGGVAFPMGTNLPPQQVISLPAAPQAVVHDLAVDGNDVLALLSSGSGRNDSRLGLVRVRVGGQSSVVDKPVWFADLGQEPNVYYSAPDLAWSAEDPCLAYIVVTRTKWTAKTTEERTYTLYTVALDTRQGDAAIHRVELAPLLAARGSTPTVCLYQRHLYVYRDEYSRSKLLVFSLADPRAPSLVHSEDLVHVGWLFPNSSDQYQIRLAPIPGADDATRLEVTHELAWWLWTPAGRGRVLAFAPDPGGFAMRLVLFETGPARDSVVPLHLIAQHRAGTIERSLRLLYGGRLCGSDDLAVRLGSFGVTVYDIRDPKRIKRLGHYAAGEDFSTMAVLPDKRVVIAGKRLHILDLSGKLAH